MDDRVACRLAGRGGEGVVHPDHATEVEHADQQEDEDREDDCEFDHRLTAGLAASRHRPRTTA
jgi:hypothetical protein